MGWGTNLENEAGAIMRWDYPGSETLTWKYLTPGEKDTGGPCLQYMKLKSHPQPLVSTHRLCPHVPLPLPHNVGAFSMPCTPRCLAALLVPPRLSSPHQMLAHIACAVWECRRLPVPSLYKVFRREQGKRGASKGPRVSTHSGKPRQNSTCCFPSPTARCTEPHT